MKTMMQLVTRRLWVLALVFAALVLLGPIGSQARPYSGGMLVTPVYPTTALEVTVANHPPVAIPYFEWQPVEGATVYRLQVSDQIGFNTVARDINLSHVKYLAADLGWLRDTTWYWRVRVEASPTGVGDWPAMPWTFSRSWAKNNAPVLQTPAAGATIEFFEDPIFSWSPVVGAALYVIKIDNDFDCQSPLITYSTMYTHFTPNVRLANANYYWCVLPQDPAGRDGQMSEARPLFVNYTQVTTLLEPANNSFPVYTPQFKWTAVRGAYAYLLYYSTDPTFQTNLTQVQVNQTTYTPPNSLPNDKDYYWKVRVYYTGGYLGPDSAVWKFQKKWYHKPIVLTPRNNEQSNPPLFTWTPVREAAYYRLDAASDPSFAGLYWSVTTPNTFYFRTSWSGEWNRVVYVRVVPIDGNGNEGQASLPISFRPVFQTAFPGQQYPRYYYTPPSVPTGNYIPPYDIPTSYDYALSVPTFYWERTFITGALASGPRVEASRYRLEVDDGPNFLAPIVWTYETANLSATPSDASSFTPVSSTLYYWRVTALDDAGNKLFSTETTEPWAVKIDTGRLMTPAATLSPNVLRPPQNDKRMDTLPSFEWQPQQGAVRYQIEITTTDPVVMSTVVYTANTVYTHHTPNVRVPKGTYYWRVRGLDNSNQTVGTWSETRRFFVAYQTRWACANTDTTLLPTIPGTLIAQDTSDELGNFELTTLYSAQDKDNWYVGFNHGTLKGTVTYGLYFDSNQEDESVSNGGATTAPPGRPPVTTSVSFRPEYALYLTYNGTRFISETISLYRWDKNLPVPDWDPQIKNLVDQVQVGGGFTYSSTMQYAQLRIPKTAIGDEGFSPFMLGLALFTSDSPSGAAIDTVPSNGHNTSMLTEFKAIADRPSLALPGDDILGADGALLSTPSILAETPDVDWLRGYKLQVARDPVFNSIVATFDLDCIGCESFVDIFQFFVSPINVQEDNTLYWRYFIKHIVPGTSCGSPVYGPPSDAHVYDKSGPAPRNLRTEGNYSTPTFRWDDVEGAATYRLQWSQNPDFSGNVYDRTSNHDAFTPEYPLIPGTYYWRVRQENYTGVYYASAWSVSTTLAITLPQVVITQPVPGATVSLPPTFKWAAVLTPTVRPTWGAPYYRLQIATSPTGFGSPFEDVDLDTTTWTPNRTYPDGNFYWRIAVRDASRNDGPYTQIYTFTKQYPAPTLIAPLSGGRTGDYPEFEWEMVSGAASYRLQVATNPQFTSLAVDAYTNNVNFIPTNKLATGSYYWRVAMLDRDGRQGPFNDATLIVDPYPYRVYTPLVRK